VSQLGVRQCSCSSSSGSASVSPSTIAPGCLCNRPTSSGMRLPDGPGHGPRVAERGDEGGVEPALAADHDHHELPDCRGDGDRAVTEYALCIESGPHAGAPLGTPAGDLRAPRRDREVSNPRSRPASQAHGLSEGGNTGLRIRPCATGPPRRSIDQLRQPRRRDSRLAEPQSCPTHGVHLSSRVTTRPHPSIRVWATHRSWLPMSYLRLK